MNKSTAMQMHAENCAELAELSEEECSRRRYKRMEQAWLELAKTQAWLDGEKADHNAQA
jgi:hypothetical protein